jgi:hypothetical protein
MSSKHFFGKLLILAFTLLLISSGMARAEMKLYDADNQFLGILLADVIYIPSLDMVAPFHVDEAKTPKGKYVDIRTCELYYSGPDCAGNSYVYAGDSAGKVICKKGLDYRVLNIASSATFAPSSYLDASGTCHAIVNSEEAFFFPLQSVTLPFSTPWKHPIHWEYTESKSKVVVIPLLGNQ